MKKSILFISALLLLTSCYEKYVRDYDDGAAVYTTYQYDLRTFVLDENESFDFTVALGGVISNGSDIKVNVVLDNELLTKDLSTLIPDGGYESFTAMDAFSGKAKFGTVCQQYVVKDITDAGLKSLTVLPEAYYTIGTLNPMTVKSGRHTATATIKATDFIREDAKAFKPYYALGFQITGADGAATIPGRNFEIIVVRCENRFFGNWGHGGYTALLDVSGQEILRNEYDYSIADDKVYTFTTVDPKTVLTDKMSDFKASLKLTLNDDNTVKVESGDGQYVISEIPGQPSVYNDAKLLQDRRIDLNYRFENGGYTYEVHDYLLFRNRMRDGVNEWQDLNQENYK